MNKKIKIYLSASISNALNNQHICDQFDKDKTAYRPAGHTGPGRSGYLP